MENFIKELVEARMFKYQRDFGSFDNADLANLLMVCTLLLVATKDRSEIKNYVTDTMAYQDFKYIRSHATDLANLITVIDNYDDREITIKTPGIHLPMFQYKQMMRELESENTDISYVHRFLLNLENKLKITNSSIRNMRRTVLSWNSASDLEKQRFFQFAKQFLFQNANNMDLHKNYDIFKLN